MTSPAAPSRDEARGYLGLVLLGAAIGIPAALVAALFLAIIKQLETWLWTDLPNHMGESSPPWYLIVGLPIVGAVVVWASRQFLPGDGGHKPVDGINATPTPWRYAPGVALAAIGTLGFGLVLGPEAPLIALGSAVGVAMTPVLKVPEAGKRVLATAGSFSAVSAVFGGPLVGGMLLLEAGIAAGAKLIPALIPGLVASATGYVVIIGFGNWGGLNEAGLSVGGLPAYSGTSIGDLLLAVCVGLIAALVIAPVQALAKRIDVLSQPTGPRRMLGLLLAGAAAVGVLALIAQAMGANYNEELFSGQSALPEVLAESSVGVLIVLVIAKGLGYAISLGSGFRGGPVFPSIFLGVVIATIAVVLFDASPTWAAAVGTAAGMTAATNLIFSSLLFSMLIVGTNGQDALPAAVLAAATAWITMKVLRMRAAPDPTENLAATPEVKE